MKCVYFNAIHVKPEPFLERFRLMHDPDLHWEDYRKSARYKLVCYVRAF